MTIGRIIGDVIKKKGLTQVEVARQIGKSTTALSQIINGAYEPNSATLDKICDVLDIPKPILYFMTISESDIPEDKLEVYRILEPGIREFIEMIFGKDKTNLSLE